MSELGVLNSFRPTAYMAKWQATYDVLCFIYSYNKLAMHSLAAESRPRLSETGTNWLVFDTSCYTLVGESVASQVGPNLNKVGLNIVYSIVLTRRVPVKRAVERDEIPYP